jgi:hypothetical protein
MAYFSVSCFELSGYITRNVIYGDVNKADDNDDDDVTGNQNTNQMVTKYIFVES